MLSTLSKVFSRRYIEFLSVFSPENRFWHFKQIVSNVRSSFLALNWSSAELAQRVIEVKLDMSPSIGNCTYLTLKAPSKICSRRYYIYCIIFFFRRKCWHQDLFSVINKNNNNNNENYAWLQVRFRVTYNLHIEGWAQDYGNSNVFLKPLFRGNLDPFVNNANLGAIAHTSNGT